MSSKMNVNKLIIEQLKREMHELKKENQVLRNDNLQKNTLQWENDLIKQEKCQLEDDIDKKKSEFVKSLAEYKSQKEVTTGRDLTFREVISQR